MQAPRRETWPQAESTPGVAGQAWPIRQPRALQGTPVMTSASGRRGDTVSKDNLRTPAEAASERATGCKPLGRKTNGSYPNRVLVVGTDGRPLDPCSPRRARRLLASKRARPVHGLPFAIRLLDRRQGDGRTVVHPHEVRVDPGIHTSGIAVVMTLRGEDRVVWQGELEHRRGISQRMTQRRGFRQGRRGRLRYRAPRFDNRTGGGRRTLPPSLASVRDNLMRWVTHLCDYTPVNAIVLETARFDTQAMRRPDIHGVQYQQGTLAETHLRAYIRARDKGCCQYCDLASWSTTIRFELDHVVPKSRGGSDAPHNRVFACRPCNEAKGTQSVEAFLKDQPQRLARILARKRPPLAQAPQMGWLCKTLVREWRKQGRTVRTTTGADTAWSRHTQGIAKSHTNDAACTGATSPVTRLRHVATFVAQGHGRRKQCRAAKGEAYRRWRHLPTHLRHATGAPGHSRRGGRTVHGVRTGDIVAIRTPDGRWVRGRAQVSTVQGRVAVRTDTGRHKSTNRPERVRKLAPRRGWAQKREA